MSMTVHGELFRLPLEGEAAVVWTFRPRTWIDKLRRKQKLDFAVSYCSPSDKRNNYDPSKGINIALARLQAYHEGRNSVEHRGLGGCITFPAYATPEEMKVFLRDEVYANSPISLWTKHETQEAKQLIDSLFAFLHRRDAVDRRVQTRAGDLAVIRDNLALCSVRELKKVHEVHALFQNAVPTARQSRQLVRCVLIGQYESAVALAQKWTGSS